MALTKDEWSMVQETHDAVLGMRSTLKERCPAHHKRTEKIELDMYGRPGNSGSPGLMGNVLSLIQSRKYIRWGLRGLWGIVLIAAGGALTWVIGK